MLPPFAKQDPDQPPFNWHEELIEPLLIAFAVLIPASIVFYTLAKVTGWLPSAETLSKPPPLAAKFAAENARRAGLVYAGNGGINPSYVPAPAPAAPKPAPAPAAPAQPSPLSEARLELAKYWAGLVTELIALDREASAVASVKAETPLDSNKSDSGAAPSPGVTAITAPAWDRQARESRLVKSILLCEREYDRVVAAQKATTQLGLDAAKLGRL
ncbi:uncharacterized protein LOC62_05G007141 [Vanrija pseudolonga]|uniref:Uncharacterized protein n=1 Tax=Vanrija pseudolonga TaxID=143232 RepID=A0AAF1BJM2_9TREE|nr:hypothetical protein LOC62_05G007141 [Vanrija pseudolonga]